MKYTAKEMLNDWLGSVDAKPDPAANTLRDKALKKIITSKDRAFWLDLIKTAYGIESGLKEADFVSRFRKEDESFPLVNNGNLVKVLANVAICYRLESGDSDLNHWLSLAIVNINFMRTLDSGNNVPIKSYALENIEVNSKKLRSFDFERIYGQLQSLQEAGDDEQNQTVSAGSLLTLLKLNIKLYEELNILWWLYGSHSRFSQKDFSTTDKKELAIFAARELFDLTKVLRLIDPADQFFIKVLGSQRDITNLYDVVNSVTELLRKNAILFFDAISEFSPVSNALKISLDFSQGDDWSSTYKKKMQGLDPKQDISTSEISMQFYRELMFLRLSTNGDFK